MAIQKIITLLPAFSSVLRIKRLYSMDVNFKNFSLLLIGCAILFTLAALLHAALPEDLMQGIFAKGIAVDLREPLFCNGVLTTEKGGVITGPYLRIQAKRI